MDGLVLDTETGYRQAWQQAGDELDLNLTEDFLQSLAGQTGGYVIRQLQHRCGHGFDVEAFKRVSAERWTFLVQKQGIPLKKGFLTLLALIKQLELPFCLATNSRRGDALYCLELAGLGGVFPVIVSGDEVENPKPAADIFIHAARLLGLPAEHCLVLEDTPVGIAAAVAAGMPYIYVPSCASPHAQITVNALAVHQHLEQTAEYLATILKEG